jgi:hypothetical protein
VLLARLVHGKNQVIAFGGRYLTLGMSEETTVIPVVIASTRNKKEIKEALSIKKYSAGSKSWSLRSL